jgi:hypothetical protein
MADWIDAYHERRRFEDVSMGCKVVSSPQLKPGEIALADFEFTLDADGKFLYTTMVPRKEEGDG